MRIDLDNTIGELERLKIEEKFSLSSLSPLSINTLWGWTWERKNRFELLLFLLENKVELEKSIPSLVERLRRIKDIFIPFNLCFPSENLIGFGTYGWKYDPSLIKKALEKEVYMIDTAETYGYGKVEKELGKVLIEGKGKTLIATKVSRNNMSFNSIIGACKRSIEKLNVERIDLYQIHWLNPKFLLEETLKGLKRLHEHNAILYLGVCNHSFLQLMETLVRLGKTPLSFVQIRYNLLNREAENFLIPFCLCKGIKVIAYKPFLNDFSQIKSSPGFKILEEIGKKYHSSSSQIVLAWMFSKGVIPIPATNNILHLEENMDSRSIYLSEEEIKEIEENFPNKN